MHLVAALIPPLMWAIHLAIVHASVCDPADGYVALNAATLISAGIMLASGVWGWRIYQSTKGRAEHAREVISARYFGLVALIGSIIAVTAVVLQTAVLKRYC